MSNTHKASIIRNVHRLPHCHRSALALFGCLLMSVDEAAQKNNFFYSFGQFSV